MMETKLTRLEKELEQIKNLMFIREDTKKVLILYYQNEINQIKKYGANNNILEE